MSDLYTMNTYKNDVKQKLESTKKHCPAFNIVKFTFSIFGKPVKNLKNMDGVRLPSLNFVKKLEVVFFFISNFNDPNKWCVLLNKSYEIQRLESFEFRTRRLEIRAIRASSELIGVS